MRIKDIIDFVTKIEKRIETVNRQIILDVRAGKDTKNLISLLDKLENEKDNILYNFTLETDQKLMDKIDYITYELLF